MSKESPSQPSLILRWTNEIEENAGKMVNMSYWN